VRFFVRRFIHFAHSLPNIKSLLMDLFKAELEQTTSVIFITGEQFPSPQSLSILVLKTPWFNAVDRVN
jgi:hypothetical protein